MGTFFGPSRIISAIGMVFYGSRRTDSDFNNLDNVKQTQLLTYLLHKRVQDMGLHKSRFGP